MRDLDAALANVDMTYSQIVEIANDIVAQCTVESDQLVNRLKANSENLTNEDVRKAMLELALTSYSFSEIKEKSTLKAECAEILRKELYAREFNLADGSVAVRDNTAVLNSSQEVLVEAIYNLVSSILKVKLDELHRIVDALKSIIMSRMSEAKLTALVDNGQE